MTDKDALGKIRSIVNMMEQNANMAIDEHKRAKAVNRNLLKMLRRIQEGCDAIQEMLD